MGLEASITTSYIPTSALKTGEPNHYDVLLGGNDEQRPVEPTGAIRPDKGSIHAILTVSPFWAQADTQKMPTTKAIPNLRKSILFSSFIDAQA